MATRCNSLCKDHLGTIGYTCERDLGHEGKHREAIKWHGADVEIRWNDSPSHNVEAVNIIKEAL